MHTKLHTWSSFSCVHDITTHLYSCVAKIFHAKRGPHMYSLVVVDLYHTYVW